MPPFEERLTFTGDCYERECRFSGQLFSIYDGPYVFCEYLYSTARSSGPHCSLNFRYSLLGHCMDSFLCSVCTLWYLHCCMFFQGRSIFRAVDNLWLYSLEQGDLRRNLPVLPACFLLWRPSCRPGIPGKSYCILAPISYRRMYTILFPRGNPIASHLQ